MTFHINRGIVKAQLFARVPYCQWPGCTERPTEMHELIWRSRTEGNEEARNRSFVAPLCAALCRQHHEEAHSTQGATAMLLQVNILLYGIRVVQSALDFVQAAMHSHLNIQLGDKPNEEQGSTESGAGVP